MDLEIGSFIAPLCCGLATEAVKHHTATCSLPVPSGMGKRIERAKEEKKKKEKRHSSIKEGQRGGKVCKSGHSSPHMSRPVSIFSLSCRYFPKKMALPSLFLAEHWALWYGVSFWSVWSAGLAVSFSISCLLSIYSWCCRVGRTGSLYMVQVLLRSSKNTVMLSTLV